jgi:glutamate/tyrosine decarboxylase-like PLP-dependent enzyme
MSDTPFNDGRHTDGEKQMRAWMLGPKAENADIFQEMFLEAFQDYCYWRRNFHPEDGSTVSADDRMSPPFQNFQETLRDHLFEMLSHLKRSVPFFSPRYLGHMNTDLLIPALLGYFAAMFYNQNNVAGEASTLTKRFEIESLELIRDMLGYPEEAWGHLCSGGTTANMESLWAARNLRLFPYGLALTVRETSNTDLKDRLCELNVPSREQQFGDLLDNDALQKITIDDVFHLNQKVKTLAQSNPDWAEMIDDRSVKEIGLMALTNRCRQQGIDVPDRFRIVVSKNVHYSLQKSIGLLGLGKADLLKVPLNEQYRMNIGEMKRKVHHCHEENECVLAVVGVHGSTEEGSVDDFSAIADFRERIREEGSGDFWIHGDACYGGYALSLLRPDEVSPRDISTWMWEMAKSEWEGSEGATPPTTVGWSDDEADEWVERSEALARSDSISIDPHKLGYVPYPAGAVLYRDWRSRQFVQHNAPYINEAEPTGGEDDGQEDIWDTEIGSYTLEGSRPGAASAATWLAHKTVPLDRSGHGRVVARSILGAHHLKHALETAIGTPGTQAAETTGNGTAQTGTDESSDSLRCAFLTDRPDLNILCYTFPTQIDGEDVPLYVLNRSLQRLYDRLLPTEESQVQKRDFVIARTKLDYKEYGDVLNTHLDEWGVPGRVRDERDIERTGNPWTDDDGIKLVRTVVMGPFLYEASTRRRLQEEKKQIVYEYAEFLHEEFPPIVREVMAESLPEERRPALEWPILVLDDDRATRSALSESINNNFRTSYDDEAGAVFEAGSLQAGKDKTQTHAPRVALVDMELDDLRDGIDYLTFVKENLDCLNGAIVFTGAVETEGKLHGEIKGIADDTFKVEFMEKPNPNRQRQFSIAMHRLLTQLWSIGNGAIHR